MTAFNGVIDIHRYDGEFMLKVFTYGGNNSALNHAYPVARTEEIESALAALPRCTKTKDNEGLKNLGRILYQSILPDPVKKYLAGFKSGAVTFNCAEEFGDIPWEILHNGSEFLGIKFAIGRVITYRDYSGDSDVRYRARTASDKSRLLLCIGDCDNISNAKDEASRIADICSASGKFTTNKENNISKETFKRELCEEGYDIVHFSGHSCFDESEEASGLKLSDGLLDVDSIRRFGWMEDGPLLVFSNSCSSCTTSTQSSITGIAGAFLKIGARNFIGCCCPVEDSYASQMAQHFYQKLNEGYSNAEALRYARKTMKDKGAMWAAYRLFGDASVPVDPEVKSRDYRAPSDSDQHEKSQAQTGKKVLFGVVTAALLIVFVFVVLRYFSDYTAEAEKESIAAVTDAEVGRGSDNSAFERFKRGEDIEIVEVIKKLNPEAPAIPRKLSELSRYIGYHGDTSAIIQRAELLRFIIQNRLKPKKQDGSLLETEEWGYFISHISHFPTITWRVPEIFDYLLNKYSEPCARNFVQAWKPAVMPLIDRYNTYKEIVEDNISRIKKGLPIDSSSDNLTIGIEDSDADLNRYCEGLRRRVDHYIAVITALTNSVYINDTQKYADVFFDRFEKEAGECVNKEYLIGRAYQVIAQSVLFFTGNYERLLQNIDKPWEVDGISLHEFFTRETDGVSLYESLTNPEKNARRLGSLVQDDVLALIEGLKGYPY